MLAHPARSGDGQMRGSIRQRNSGSWELRVFTGRDPLSGRRQYLTKTFRGGKRAAERELAAMASGAEASAPTAAMTVGTVLERWFERASPDLSPSTVATTRIVLDSYILPHVGSTPSPQADLGEGRRAVPAAPRARRARRR